MAVIRQAVPADAGIIKATAEQIWVKTYESIIGLEQVRYMLELFYSLEKLEKQIASGEQTFLLLLENDNLVAFAAFSPRTEDADVYKLHKLYCLDEMQGKGYGKLLVHAVEDAVMQAGKTVLELNVNRHNPAKTFYEKLGYSIAYDEDIDIGSGFWMNDHVMRKVLG